MRFVKLPNKKTVSSMMFSTDGQTLAVSQEELFTIVRPFAEPSLVRNFGREQLIGMPYSGVRLVATTPGGGFVANGGIWTVRMHPDREHVSPIMFDHTDIPRIEFSEDGRLAIAYEVRSLRRVRHWQLTEATALEHVWDTPRPPDLQYMTFGFFPDGSRVAVAGRDEGGILAIYGLDRLSRVALCALPIVAPEGVLVSPDGSRIAVLAVASTHIYDADNLDNKPVRVVNPGRRKMTGCVFHPSSGRLLTTGRDSTVRVWDVQTGKEIHAYDWGIGRLSTVACSPDGMLCAAAGSHGRVVVWDWDG